MGNRRNPSSPKSQRCHRPDASPPPPPRARRFAAFVGRFNASAFALLLSKSNTFPQTGHVLQLFLPPAPGEGSRGGGSGSRGHRWGCPRALRSAHCLLCPRRNLTQTHACAPFLWTCLEKGALNPYSYPSISVPISFCAPHPVCRASGPLHGILRSAALRPAPMFLSGKGWPAREQAAVACAVTGGFLGTNPR